jgi:DNA-binding response OmpR family regulator
MNVAVVGGNAKFCLQLQELLQSQNHRVLLVPEPSKALGRLEGELVDLIVVDGMPSKDAALELIRTLRGHALTRRVPILCVNPNGSVTDVVDILDSGADDYLVKPFNGQIFLARVRTLLRRQIWSGAVREEPVAIIESGSLKVHLVERTVRVGQEEPVLTRLEFDLLAHLVRHKDQVLRRAEILEAVWKYPEDVETRTLDKHVENLRKKLGKSGVNIRTVHGVGYRLMSQDSAIAEPAE